MTDLIMNPLKLAVVVFFALACAGQQNSPTAFASDRAATPDVVTNTFDSAVVVDAAPSASAPTPAPVPSAAAKTANTQVPAPRQVAANTQPEAAAQVAASNEPVAPPPAVFQQRHPRYLLRAGDVFDVNFEYSSELNQSVTVQPDGFITLREAGDIYVAGLTLEQLNQAVHKGYEGILHAPSIAIVPKNFEQPYFVVGGEVKTPGKFDLRGPMTVAQAVALAGGFTESAKHSHVLLFHRESPDQAIVVHTLNIKRMLNHEDLKEDAELRPGDMIYVPQNTLSKIKGYVIPKATVGPTVRPQL